MTRAAVKTTQYNYLRSVVLKDRQEYIRRCLEMLHEVRKDFDTIAISGMSGALVGPVVASRMRKGLLLVRKEVTTEKSHSHLQVEGTLSPRYVILDDFCSTGRTLERIRMKVEESVSRELLTEAQLVRVVLYSDSDDYAHWMPDHYTGPADLLWSWEKWLRLRRGVGRY